MTDPQEELTVLPALMNYRDTAQHAFVPPSVASVAASARRRHRRRIGVVTAATVLLVGAGTAVAATQLPRQATPPLIDPTPAPTYTSAPTPTPALSPTRAPTPTPTRSVSLEEAFLTPEDLGPGFSLDPAEDLGDWSMEYFTQLCEAYEPKNYPGPELADRKGGARGFIGPNKHVVQSLSQGSTEYAQWAMDDTRRWVKDCAAFSSGGTRHTMEIVASGFAGDDSFLVKVAVGTGEGGNYWLYLRKGGTLSQIGFGGAHTLAQMQDIGRKAAARM